MVTIALCVCVRVFIQAVDFIDGVLTVYTSSTMITTFAAVVAVVVVIGIIHTPSKENKHSH